MPQRCPDPLPFCGDISLGSRADVTLVRLLEVTYSWKSVAKEDSFCLIICPLNQHFLNTYLVSVQNPPLASRSEFTSSHQSHCFRWQAQSWACVMCNIQHRASGVTGKCHGVRTHLCHKQSPRKAGVSPTSARLRTTCG